MLARNYAKDTTGIFTRILAKITSVTALQYMNEVNKRPLGQLKYALSKDMEKLSNTLQNIEQFKYA